PSRRETAPVAFASSRHIRDRQRSAASLFVPKIRWRYYAIELRDLIRVSLDAAIHARRHACQTCLARSACANSAHGQVSSMRKIRALDAGVALSSILLATLQDDRPRRMGLRGVSRSGG